MNLGGSIKINKCAVLTLIVCLLIIIYIVSSSPRIDSIDVVKEKVNLRKLTIGLILAAKAGGEEVLKISEQKDFGVKSKGVDDPVTLADVNSHCKIAIGLWRLFPGLNLISEEDVLDKTCPNHAESINLDPTVLGSSDIPDLNVPLDDLSVWIDPLDATKEFTEKLFHYVSVMICVAIKGDPVIGVVHFPFSKQTYWAWKDNAMSENLKGVKLHHGSPVKSPIVIVSRSHPGQVEVLAKKTFGDKVSIIHAAGSGYKIIQVIEGNATVYLHNTKIKKWDLCAGNAIVHAVGGRMRTIDGDHLINYSADSNRVVEEGLRVELHEHAVVN